MEFLVLTFVGESGSGKDLCGQWVVDNKEFCRVAFADPLKRFCRLVFQFSDQQLWGPSQFRNEDVAMDWEEARVRLGMGIPSWVDTLALTNIEKANYAAIVDDWFTECRRRGDKISPRVALQLLGTEYGRSFKKSLWMDTLFKRVVPWIREGLGYSKKEGPTNEFRHHRGVVITDCRFKNEMQASKDNGAKVIKLIRLSREEQPAEEFGISGHASEAEQRSIPEDYYDVVLRMKEGLDNVHHRLLSMFDKKEWQKECS